MLTFYKKPFLPIIQYIGKKIEENRFHDMPILIGGCGRSGTTLLLSILSAHPAIFACPKELGLFNEIVVNPSGSIKPVRIDRLYTAFLVNPIPRTATRWCEKSPSNVLHIEQIDRYFKGKFRFIHIIRDGRDVVLSVHPTAKDRYWVDPQRWVNDVSAGLAYESHPCVLTIFYEQLIRQYEDTIRLICDFLQLPLSEEIISWHQHATVRKNRAYFQDVQKISESAIEKWANPENQERVNELLNYPRARALLQRLGYHNAEIQDT